MKRAIRFVPVLILAACVLHAAAAEDGPRVIEGDVLEMRQGVVDSEGRAWDEATVRGEDGLQYRLRLQRTGDGPSLCGEGDRIRARVMAGGTEEGAYMARKMYNHSKGEMIRLRNSRGEPLGVGDQIRERQRNRSCEGSGEPVQSRRRVHSTGGSGRRGGGGRR